MKEKREKHLTTPRVNVGKKRAPLKLKKRRKALGGAVGPDLVKRGCRRTPKSQRNGKKKVGRKTQKGGGGGRSQGKRKKFVRMGWTVK